jgi:GAF domain-containing protein
MDNKNRERIVRLCRRIATESDTTLFRLMSRELYDLLESHVYTDSKELVSTTKGQNRLNGDDPVESNTWIHGLLEFTMAATAADFGNVQILDSSARVLKIAAQRGFDSDFLRYFDSVRLADACACGAAMKSRSRIVVPDIAASPFFSSSAKEVLLRANVRSVQSTPLVNRRGSLVGMVSTHYRRPHGPAPEMWKCVDEIVSGFMADHPGRQQPCAE